MNNYTKDKTPRVAFETQYILNPNAKAFYPNTNNHTTTPIVNKNKASNIIKIPTMLNNIQSKQDNISHIDTILPNKYTKNRPNCNQKHFTTILHQNIQSLYNKRERIELFIENIQKELNVEVNILCLSETWMKSKNVSNYNIENYTLANYYCRPDEDGHGGISIYTRNNTNFKTLDLKTKCEDKIFEYSAIHLPTINTVAVCVYRSSKLSTKFYKKKFIEKLESVLQEIAINSKKVIISGDFNIHFDSDSWAKKELDVMIKTFNLHITINESTRITHNSQSLIDNILTNINDFDYKTHNTYSGLSDHSHAQILIYHHPGKSKSLKKITRSFKEKNILQFSEAMKDTDWSEIYETKHVEDKYQIFITKFTCLLNKYFPKRLNTDKFIVKNNWITPGIRKSCETKRLLFEMSRIYKEPNFLEYFKNYKYILKNTILMAKQIPAIKRIKESKNKSKVIWNLIDNNPKKNKKNQTLVKAN